MARLPRLPKSMFRPPPGFKKPKVEDFRSDMQRVGEEIAEQFKEQVIENIETNYYGFELAQSTIERKGSDVPWINSHELVDSIYREGTIVSVEDTPREDSKLTNLQLAIVQEYGTKDRHIPPRPIFRNTFRDFESDAKDKMLSFLKLVNLTVNMAAEVTIKEHRRKNKKGEWITVKGYTRRVGKRVSVLPRNLPASRAMNLYRFLMTSWVKPPDLLLLTNSFLKKNVPRYSIWKRNAGINVLPTTGNRAETRTKDPNLRGCLLLKENKCWRMTGEQRKMTLSPVQKMP